MRYANAGGCPPLLLDGEGGRFLGDSDGPPLGAGDLRRKHNFRLEAEATVLLFTHGLVESRAVARSIGMAGLRLAAIEGPDPLDGLCKHVLDTCTRRLRRDDDICLVGLRLVPQAATAVPPRGERG